MISTDVTNTVSDPFDSFTVTEIASSPVNVYVPSLPKPALPKQVVEAAKPMQTRETTVIDTAYIIATIKTLAAIGALWLLGAALLALAALFIKIVMPIIIGLVILCVLAVALRNTSASDLIMQLLSEIKRLCCSRRAPSEKQVEAAEQRKKDQELQKKGKSTLKQLQREYGFNLPTLTYRDAAYLSKSLLGKSD